MKIIIHRGIDQIGGCITEIATDKARILIDLGRNLPNNKGVSDDPNANEQTIASLTKGVDAIFYTHYHGDHVGLMEYVPDDIDQYIGQAAKEVTAVKAKYLRKDLAVTDKLKTFSKEDKITINNITVTPYLVSHSACDSYMFLIETEGKKILHTGDFRDHGYIGKGLAQFVPMKIGQVDFLITEGTMLSRSSESVPSEFDLKLRTIELMQRYKYVFVLGSSTDMDRLATFHKANLRGRLFVCDAYQKEVLDVFTKNNAEHSNLYKFDHLSLFPTQDDKRNALLDKMTVRGFCMMVRVNKFSGKYSQFVERVIAEIPNSERVFVYSMWSGYLDSPRHQKTEYIEFASKFENMERIHTSGHATQQCLVDLCNMVNPRSAIIPIHSEKSDNFRHLPLSDELKAKITTQSISIDDVSIEI